MNVALELSAGLLPGQGAFRLRGLKRLAADDAGRSVVDLVDEVASELLGRRLLPLIDSAEDGDDERLFETDPDLVQMGVFATSVALFHAFRSRGAGVSVLVGHSLGEISALVCSGALDVRRGAEVLASRIAVLREHDSSGGGMLALACGRERAQQVLDLLPSSGAVVAVDNGRAQSVVSGSKDALNRVERIAEAIGVTVTVLRAPHPFHNDLLQPARRALAERIGSLPPQGFEVPVFSPILGRFYRQQDDLGALLASHLVLPVEFGPTVARLHGGGTRVWVEFGAGRALTNVVRSGHPGATVLTPLHGGPDALPDALAFLGGGPAAGFEPVRPEPVRSDLAPSGPAGSVLLTSGAAGHGTAVAFEHVAPPVAVVSVPVVPVVAPRSAEPVVEQRSRAEIEAELRTLYATTLEYPEEVFEAGAELEADLGVDSVKQTELLARVGERFELGPRPAGMRMSDYRTFDKVVDFVVRSLTVGGAR